ncbi:MAG: ribosome biogenesis GTPase Der [Treponema sp.]|uniref:ribosome biogenesis GTPase Der n=1 Tax=Treponema sp. TaxID=166 RepID=UPI00298DB962|nr:ribosome biogenesis GTPase Der [Treponema sp.]MBR5932402.1 ribosome biogenesis GTPase Der [Treponema sp.]
MAKKRKPDFSKPKEIKNKSFSSADNSAEENKFDSSKIYFNLPLVVIAGRPNVGKSTLFNRFMHKRIAITDPTPGVTRDPVEGDAFILGKPVHLMDTGGYKLTRDTGTMEAVMDDLVVEKTLSKLKQADVILLLLEAGQITPEDEEFIQQLRPYWDKVIAAVNKTEGGKNQDYALNYMKFGFKELLFISAEHGDKIPELQQKLINNIDFSNVTEGTASDVPIRIALLGKPNTGKSTLSNRLTHTEASIVSDYAGTTRDVVEGQFRYNEREFKILDTAGIRRKAKVKENIEYYSVNRAIKTIDECDIVFLMIDAEIGLAEQDKKICSLAYEQGRGIIFILNKWDTQEKGRTPIKKAEENIRIMFGQMSYAPIVCISALEGNGIKLLMDTALELYEQLTKKVSTSVLNTALKDWLFRYPPPASRTAHFKIRYMTQTSVNPAAFTIFATKPEVVPQTYITFLKNRIREDLGFDKIPVQLELKASRQKWEDRE